MKSLKILFLTLAFITGIAGALVTTSSKAGDTKAGLVTANVNLKSSGGSCFVANNTEIETCRIGTGNICTISLNGNSYTVWDQTFSGATPTCLTQYERP